MAKKEKLLEMLDKEKEKTLNKEIIAGEKAIESELETEKGKKNNQEEKPEEEIEQEEKEESSIRINPLVDEGVFRTQLLLRIDVLIERISEFLKIFTIKPSTIDLE